MHFPLQVMAVSRIYMVTFIWLTSALSITADMEPPPSRVILRQNFGILLERVAALEIGSSQYTQVFAIEYPTLATPILSHKPMTCRQVHTNWYPICIRANQMLHRLNVNRQIAFRRAKCLIEKARQIIPFEYDHSPSGNRNRRALLPFVGRIFNFLFGTMDETEARNLHQNMEILMKKQQLTQRELGKLATNFIHLAKTTDEGFNKIAESFKSMDSVIHQLNTNMFHLAELYTNMNRTVYLMLTLLEDITINQSGIRSLEEVGNQWINNILTLSKGFLPENLISYHQMEKSLQAISIKLQEHESGFQIANPEIAYYYNIRNIGYTQSNTSLFISVPVPLKSEDLYFILYKIRAFPIHTNVTDSGATLINNVPEYLAISQNKEYYLELSYSDLRDCIGTTLKKCKVMKAASRRNAMTCSLALFLDNADMVMEKCKFDYQSENKGQIAIDLGQGYLFISGQDKFWTMNCHGKEPQGIPSCTLCIISLPCSCSLVSKHFYIPSRITNCPWKSSIQKVHGINLAYMKIFSENVEISSFTGSTAFHNTPTYDAKSITIQNMTLSSVVRKTPKFDLDLTKIADSIKRNNDLYQSTADYLLFTSDTGFSSLSNILEIVWQAVTILYIGVSICLFVLIFIRQRKLILSMAILTQPTPGNTSYLSPRNFSTFQIRTTFDKQPSPETSTPYPDCYLTQILLGILLLCGIGYKLCPFIRRKYQSRTSPVPPPDTNIEESTQSPTSPSNLTTVQTPDPRPLYNHLLNFQPDIPEHIELQTFTATTPDNSTPSKFTRWTRNKRH